MKETIEDMLNTKSLENVTQLKSFYSKVTLKHHPHAYCDKLATDGFPDGFPDGFLPILQSHEGPTLMLWTLIRWCGVQMSAIICTIV